METINKNTFLETAWDIGCELMKSAIWHGDACNWQGYSVELIDGAFQPVMRTFGADVYSGTSGIALFLSALYSERKDPILLRTIEGSIAQMKLVSDKVPPYGFYAGKPGIAATLIRIGNELNRKEWVEEGISLLESIPDTTLQIHEIDVISGAAGTIPVLLEGGKSLSVKALIDKAVALGHLLVAAAVKENEVWSWATVPSKRNLTGYSHGSSGIAVALLQLYEATNEPLFLEAARGGFNYERKTFDKAQQNWPDFRDGVSTPTANVCGMAWCHGAPGITLSRLKARELQPGLAVEDEVNIALKTTANSIYESLTNNIESNYSLCHGIAGNADILLDCGGAEHQQLAEAVGAAGIVKYQAAGKAWPSGVNEGQYTPGLMMGIAGTGYFYLRLYNKDRHKTLLMPSLH